MPGSFSSFVSAVRQTRAYECVDDVKHLFDCLAGEFRKTTNDAQLVPSLFHNVTSYAFTIRILLLMAVILTGLTHLKIVQECKAGIGLSFAPVAFQ